MGARGGIFYFSTPFSVPFFFPAGNLGKLGLGVAFSKFPPISAVPFCFPAGKLGKLRTGVVFFKFPPRNQPHAGQTKLFFGDLESRSILRPNFLGVIPYAFKCLVATCVSKHLPCTIPRLRKRLFTASQDYRACLFRTGGDARRSRRTRAP